MTLNNRHNQPVLRYYLNQPMQTLTTTNNASIDSKGYATRLFVNESDHTGQTSGGSVVSQFAAGTDNIKNGIPSVELNPKLYLGTTEKIAGTHYYDYNVSGTVLWSTAVTSSSPKISCFRYIGKTVTGQFATVESTLTSHATDISDIKLALGLEDSNPDGTQSVTARVETVEDVVRVLLGLGDSDTITASESISATANSAATNAINSALETEGSIAQAIATAKSEAIANAKVTLTAGNGITIPNSGSQDTAFTISVDTDVIATKQSVDDVADAISGVSQTVASIQSQLSTGSVATAIGEAKAAAQAAQDTADAKVASVTGPTTGLVTVTGDKEVTITVSDTIATKSYADTAASSAITTSLAGTTDGTIGKAIADVAATANSAVQSVTRASGSSTLLTVTDGTDVTISLSSEVATKSDITTEINKLSAADGAITTLSGKVSDIETSLATGGETAEAIVAAKKAGTDAQTAADAKVADVTVDGASIVSGDSGAKTAALTTTGVTAITPSSTSTSKNLATEASVAQALASITSVGVSYEVIPDGQTHTSITEPVKGRIYLEKDETNAEAGVYIEWMYTEKGWEQIGSTKTDHSSYASTITVNNEPKTVSESSVDLGAFASTVTAGNGIESGSVSTTGALSLTLTEGSTSAKGIVQLTDTYTETEDTKAATGKSIAAAIATLDSTKSVNGITVTQEDGVVSSITEELITASVPANTTSVEGNVAYVGSTKHVIAPEKFQTAAQMPATLTSWVADLSNLTVGDNMFKGTALTTFVGDLSSLTSGVNMFSGCTLDAESLEILAENLPTVSGGTIDIGLSTNAAEGVIATIKGKGWTVVSPSIPEI